MSYILCYQTKQPIDPLQAGQDQLPGEERPAAQAVELPGNGGGEGEVGGDYQLYQHLFSGA